MRQRPLPLLLVFALAACGPEFEPPSLLDDLRVLALVADPLEVGPGETTTITPVVHVPAGVTLARPSWSFCPFSAGSSVGFACAVPACEVPLAPEADGSVSASPGQLALSCIDKLSAPGGAPAQVPTELPEQVEVLFRYSVETAAGFQREAVARIPLWTGGPPESPNRPPVIAEVQIAGQPATAGQPSAPVDVDQELELRVRIDPASLDSFVDPSGRQRTEEAIVTFYATAGRFEDDKVAGTDQTVIWRAAELSAAQNKAEVYVVARDLRGGQAVLGPLVVPIQR